MQQKFLSNLVLMVVLNLLVKPVAIFGIDAVVQNRVGSETYGFYFSLLNFTYLFNILLDLGINNYTTRNVAQHPGVAHSYIGRVFGIRMVLFLLYALVTIGVAVLIGYPPSAFSILAWLILNQFFITLIAYIRSHFAGMLLFRTDALLSVLDRALLILICGTVLYGSLTDTPFQIEWFVWMQTACYAITLLTGAVLLVVRTGLPKVRFQPAFSMVLLRRSIPFAILIVLMMLYTRTDSVMLERLHPNGKYEAGIYAQGFRLLDALFMFAMIISNLLFPIFSAMLKRKEDTRQLLNMSAKLLIGGSLALAVFAWWNAPQILGLLYTTDLASSAPPFQFLMLTFVGMCTTLIYGTLLTARGELKLLNRVAFVGFVLNLTLNAVLIPSYGAIGAAVATMCTQGVVGIVQFYAVYKQFGWQLNWKSSLQFSLFVVLLVLGLWASDNFAPYLWLQITYPLVLILAFRIIDLRVLRLAISEKTKSTA